MTQKVKPSTLADTAVTPGTYGGTTQLAVVTVDQQGRATYAANTPVSGLSIANTQITGLILSSQINSVANTKITGLILSDQIDTVAGSKVTGAIAGGQISGLTGEVKMWPTATAPTGYLLCDGSAVSRTTYADLFAIIGTTFGVGNGSTTFNLPNFNDRMPIGAGSLYSLAATGGSKDAIVVSHTHTASASDNGHSHLVSTASLTTPWATTGTDQNGGSNYLNASGSVRTTSNTANINVSISTTGSSGTNANLPPYLGIFFIIRHV